jgi:hypothetical protein
MPPSDPQALCREASDLVMHPLIDAPASAFVAIFGDFFDGKARDDKSDEKRSSKHREEENEKGRQNELHVEHFFNHFAFDGPKKGAVAIEQYAIRKRYEAKKILFLLPFFISRFDFMFLWTELRSHSYVQERDLVL